MGSPVSLPNSRPIDLYGLEAADLARLGPLADERPFRARQIARWLYNRGARTFGEMTDLSRAVRLRLEEACTIGRLRPVEETVASDDGATKYLFRLTDGGPLEAVWIRDGVRHTLCVSSQAGCAYGCAFCATATLKAGRNLTSGEIVSQVAALREEMAGRFPTGAHPPHNVVFMGMGEPLANYDNLIRALRILTGEPGIGIAARRITISTVGLAPEILRLAAEPLDVRLALSLNATTDEIRSSIMPVNRKYPIERLLDVAAEYQRRKGRPVTLEYVLLEGVNDTIADARRLAGFVRSLRGKVNLISYNPHAFAPYTPVPDAKIEEFRSAMLPIAPRVTITVRWSKGREIQAACGQLAARAARATGPV